MTASRRQHAETAKRPASGERTYTIDEVAAAAGVPTRTVRLYQTVGALPRPQRHGRVGIYSDAHLQQLRLIAQLQERGLRLRAIRDVLRQAGRRHLSLEDWLGIGEHLRTPWSPETAEIVDEGALRPRIGDHPPGFIAGLVRAGLVRRDAELPVRYVVPSPTLLEIAVALQHAGVDVDVGGAAVARIRKRMRRMADDLLSHFVKHLGRGFARSGNPTDVGEALAALRRHGADAVRLVFAQEMERALRDAIARGAIPVLERRTP